MYAPKTHFALLIIGLTLTGCSRWLNIDPEDAISDRDLYATGFGYRNALNGVYISLAEESLYGRELTWGFMSALSGDYDQSDDVRMPPYRDAAALQYRTPETAPIVNAIWEKGYLAIANINKLLEEIRSSKAEDFEYGAQEQALIRSESLALRAMIHFDLLRLFAPSPDRAGNVPYLPYRDSYGPSEEYPIAVRPFIERILDDLSEAEEGLRTHDLRYHSRAMCSSSMQSITGEWSARYRFDSDVVVDEMGFFFWYRGFRMNILSLLALRARVCLYAGPDFYQNAKDAAGELYDHYYKELHWIGFTPQRDLLAPLGRRYTKAAHDVLFGLYSGHLSARYASVSGVGSGERVSLPLRDVDDLYASDHVGVYRDLRLDQMIGHTNETYTQYYSLKYVAPELSTVLKMEGSLIPVVRFSEVCHILAEIACREGDLTAAKEYLETVRRARGADRSIDTSSASKMMEEILTDIRKESTAEGQSFYAYKRLSIPIREGVTPDRYTLPIPDSESSHI